MTASWALASLAASGVEVRVESGGLRLVGPRGAVSDELRAELPAVAPALHLIASGRWRDQLASWSPWWRSRWSQLGAANTAAGLAPEVAEAVAFLAAGELPDDLEPTELLAPTAPCPDCGVVGEVAVCGLGACEGCGWVPRDVWEWSGDPITPPQPPQAYSLPFEAREPITPSPLEPPSPESVVDEGPQLEECARCSWLRLPRATRCDGCGSRRWVARE